MVCIRIENKSYKAVETSDTGDHAIDRSIA